MILKAMPLTVLRESNQHSVNFCSFRRAANNRTQSVCMCSHMLGILQMIWGIGGAVQGAGFTLPPCSVGNFSLKCISKNHRVNVGKRMCSPAQKSTMPLHDWVGWSGMCCLLFTYLLLRNLFSSWKFYSVIFMLKCSLVIYVTHIMFISSPPVSFSGGCIAETEALLRTQVWSSQVKCVSPIFNIK